MLNLKACSASSLVVHDHGKQRRLPELSEEGSMHGNLLNPFEAPHRGRLCSPKNDPD